MGELVSTFNIELLFSWLRELNPVTAYLFIGFSALLENLFPPWPGDTVTVMGGVMISQGVITAVGCMVALVIGNLLGAFIMYFSGARLLIFLRKIHNKIRRPRFVKKMIDDLSSEVMMERAKYWFDRRGIYFVLLSRFSAGIRFFVSIVAGISHMNPFLFGIFFTVGVVVWNILLLGGGYLVGNEWHKIIEWLRIYNVVVLSLILIVAAVVVKHRFVNRVSPPEK